jgi:hypothetical protein
MINRPFPAERRARSLRRGIFANEITQRRRKTARKPALVRLNWLLAAVHVRRCFRSSEPFRAADLINELH